MCTCEGACICVQVPLCGNQRSTLDVFLSYSSFYDLIQGLSLTWSPVTQLNWLGKNARDLSYPFCSIGIMQVSYYIHIFTKDMNSGPNACAASILLTEPSSCQP